MALIQRYTTELSAHAGTSHQYNDNTQSVGQVIQDLATLKRQDDDEKRYFHSLNNRLEELLHSLHDLEIANKKLRDDLNLLIANWGILGGTRSQFIQELDAIVRRLGEQSRQKLSRHAQTKIFDEQIQLTDRMTNVFTDVLNLHRDKSQIVFDLINDLEDQLRKICSRLDISNAQVKSHDDDYQCELTKFRSYLSEWAQLSLDKQNLLNEIQSLKEHYNLRLAYNQEEINEWLRLLNRISQESKNYYRDYLDTIKQKIQIDYEQMAKEQQMDIEIQLQTRVKEVENKIQMGLPIDEDGERRRREATQRFESRLDEHTKENDRLQNDYRILSEEIQHKRRILQDLEIELRNKARKQAEQHARLEHDTDLTRAEYYSLKDELDKLAYTLRFSVEDELKVYEALLNSIQRKKEKHTVTDDLTKYQPSISLTEKTTTIKTIKQDSNNTIPIISINEIAKPSNKWTYEAASSDIMSSTRSDSAEHDRLTEKKIIPTPVDNNRYDIKQNLLDENRTTTTTTRTTRHFDHSNAAQKATGTITNRREQGVTLTIPEIDEKFLLSKVHITRKYKGNVLIKFVDVNGRFVEIENTSNQSRDLTGWYIERTVDGRLINYTFPAYEIGPQTSVRIYGNYHRRSSLSSNSGNQLELIAPNFYDWGNGRKMHTELFNDDNVAKALFEQTIKD